MADNNRVELGTARPANTMTERRQRQLIAAAIGLTLLPFVILTIRVLGRDHGALNADDALIHVRVDDVFTMRTPIVGSYQRFGWNQPGPLYFYLLAVPYNLFGRTFSALQLGVVLLHSASIAATLWIIGRRLGWPSALWAAALLGVVVRGIGASGLSDPWEPRMSVLLIVAMVVLAWDAALGHRRSWFGLVLVASLLAQAYATVMFVAIAVVSCAVAYGVVLGARANGLRPTMRGLVPPIVFAMVLWFPVLLEQITNRPGNITRMLRFARSSSYEHLGARAAAKSLALTGAFDAPWVTSRVPKAAFTTAVDVGAASWFAPAWVAFAGALALGVVIRRKVQQQVPPPRSPFTGNGFLSLCSLIAIAAAVMGLSLSGLIPPLFVWIFEPLRAFGMLAWLPFGIAIAFTSKRVGKIVGVGSACALGIVIAMTIGSAVTGRVTPDRGARALQTAAERVAHDRRIRGATVIVTSSIGGQLFVDTGYGLDEVNAALILQGIKVVVHPDRANRYGSSRAHPRLANYEVRLIDVDSVLPGGFTELTRIDPLGRLRARRDALRGVIGERCGKLDGLRQLRQCRDRDRKVAAALRELEPIEDLPIVRFVGAPLSPSGSTRLRF